MTDLTHPSPNYGTRNGSPIQVVVMHCDAGTSDAGTLAWCADPASKVSYHVLVGRNGGAFTMVDPKHRAWHCGKSEWNGVKDVNTISLGLSFANRGDGMEPLTPIQIAVAQGIIQYWRQEYPGIAVTTHAAVATPAGRKTDPLKCPGFQLEDYIGEYP